MRDDTIGAAGRPRWILDAIQRLKGTPGEQQGSCLSTWTSMTVFFFLGFFFFHLLPGLLLEGCSPVVMED